MNPQDASQPDTKPGYSAQAAALRRFDGVAQQFWPAYLELVGRVAGATRAVLIRQDSSDDNRWKQLAEWSAPDTTAAGLALFRNSLLALAERCLREGLARRVLAEDPKTPDAVPIGLAVNLQLAGKQDPCIVALFLPQADPGALDDLILRIQLLADVPQSYQEHTAVTQARQDVEKFAVVLDTLAQVSAQSRYLAAAMALCNGLAGRLHCQRVSLGWLERGFIRAQAISRTEKFDRKMEAVQALEKVMEECLDQDDEIIWPAPPNYPLIIRDHDAFAKDQKLGSVCSVPLRHEGKIEAVLTLERESGEFTAIELQQLRLVCDQAMGRLRDLKRSDRWFGARLATFTREKLSKFLGPEHTLAKAIGVLATVLLLVLIFYKPNYRVEANYILRSHEVRFISAPFAGYIHEAAVRPGDIVQAGDVILRLNTDDLLLNESAALAELTRYSREAEKARAANQLADMRVALAQVEEVKARLALVRYQIERAEVKAPFDCVVVEGDLRSRLGAPVEQGEPMFRLARTDSLYIEAELHERDVHEVLGKSTGEIAFVSQPDKTFPVRLERIEPAALAKEGKNVFLIRCLVDGAPEAWWRPGMSGVCKINVGERRLIWILTHRTAEFLRLWLWW
jgi:multidrug resistance efflux pump